MPCTVLIFAIIVIAFSKYFIQIHGYLYEILIWKQLDFFFNKIKIRIHIYLFNKNNKIKNW